MNKEKYSCIIILIILAMVPITFAQDNTVIENTIISGPDTIVADNSIIVGPDVTLAGDAAVVLAANKNVYFTGAVYIIKGATLTLLNKKIATDVEQLSIDLLPDQYQLDQNYPNPFNPNTTLQFSLPKSGFVNLSIFNSLGQRVAILVKEELAAGKYQYQWNAAELASGTYYYQLTSGEYSQVKKMLLIK